MANNYEKFLEDKVGLLKDMLELTMEFVGFNGDQDEKAEAYIALLDKREMLLDKIKLIDNELAAGDLAGIEAGHALNLKIKETIALFLKADKNALEIAKSISTRLSKSIKDINNGKSVNQLYQNIDMLNTTRFDKSN